MEYISDLQKIAPHKTPVLGCDTALTWAMRNEYNEVIEVILEFPGIDLKMNNSLDGNSIFHWLCKNGAKILGSLLERNKYFLAQITVEDFCQPDADGVTPFLLLLKSHAGGAVLQKLIELNSKLFIGITEDVINKSILQGSILYWLCFNKISQNVFEYILDKKPQLALNITAKALCEWHVINDNSPLFSLVITEKGIAILTRLLDANPVLIDEIKDEDICKTNAYGFSAFSSLALDKIILRFLNNQRFIHLPVSFFTDVFKIENIVNASNFHNLIRREYGQQVLLYLLTNGNPFLKQLTPEVFYRGVIKESVQFMDSFFSIMAHSEPLRKFLSILFASNSELMKGSLTAAVLTRLENFNTTDQSLTLSRLLLCSNCEAGCELLQTLLNKNPHIVISTSDLYIPLGIKGSPKTSVFSTLAATAKGREILVQLFNKFSKLVSRITTEILTRPVVRLIPQDDTYTVNQENLSVLDHILASRNEGLILHLVKNPKIKSLFQDFLSARQEGLYSERRINFVNELEAGAKHLSLCMTSTSSIKKDLLKIAEEKLKAVTDRNEIIKIETWIKTDTSSPAMTVFHRYRYKSFDTIRAKLFNQTEEEQYTRSYKTLLELIENRKNSIEQADSVEIKSEIPEMRRLL